MPPAARRRSDGSPQHQAPETTTSPHLENMQSEEHGVDIDAYHGRIRMTDAMRSHKLKNVSTTDQRIASRIGRNNDPSVSMGCVPRAIATIFKRALSAGFIVFLAIAVLQGYLYHLTSSRIEQWIEHDSQFRAAVHKDWRTQLKDDDLRLCYEAPKVYFNLTSDISKITRTEFEEKLHRGLRQAAKTWRLDKAALSGFERSTHVRMQAKVEEMREELENIWNRNQLELELARAGNTEELNLA